LKNPYFLAPLLASAKNYMKFKHVRSLQPELGDYDVELAELKTNLARTRIERAVAQSNFNNALGWLCGSLKNVLFLLGHFG